ncbi:MAG: DNA replication/repair protein RecF, partial [Anaerolineae bacterium]
MRLTRLALTHFRNYERLDLELGPGVFLLLGSNAQGKTNLLEAIHYLATGTSSRADTARELISWMPEEGDIPLAARLQAQLSGGEAESVDLTMIQEGPGAPVRKVVRVNGATRPWRELPGHIRAVLFMPQDVELVAGPPAGRRRYLDAALSQLNGTYAREMAVYSRALRQRNHLLKRLRDRSTDDRQLDVWDDRLAEPGATLVALRWEAAQAWDMLARPHHLLLTEETDDLRLRYSSVLAAVSGDWDNPPPEAEPDGLRRALAERRREDIRRGSTSVGPHRDDLRFLVGSPSQRSDLIDLTVYGSRGQQRTAAVALKLAEAEHLRAVRGTEPVLLLDDVMSELDPQRRRFLLDAVEGREQVIVTATELSPFPN